MLFEYYEEISTFLELVKCGSVDLLANQKNCSKSSIWRTIDRLENFLNLKLIHRTKQGLSLTTEGRILHNSFFLSSIKFDLMTTRKVITILSGIGFSTAIIRDHIKLLSSLKKDYVFKFLSYTNSNIRLIDPKSRSAPIWSLAKFCDILFYKDCPDALTEGLYSKETLFEKIISFKIPYKLYCSERYFNECVIPIELDALSKHPCSNFSRSEDSWNIKDKNNITQAIPIELKLSSESIIAQLAFVTNHLGIACLPSTEQSLQGYKLIDLFPQSIIKYETYAVYKKKRLSRAIETPVNTLIDAMVMAIRVNQQKGILK